MICQDAREPIAPACVWCDGRYLAFTGSLVSVVSMDRLLSYFLDQFIRRGAMTFTTASGAKFRCGDGTGKLVAVRFLTADAERRVLLNPELALGEVCLSALHLYFGLKHMCRHGRH